MFDTQQLQGFGAASSQNTTASDKCLLSITVRQKLGMLFLGLQMPEPASNC